MKLAAKLFSLSLAVTALSPLAHAGTIVGSDAIALFNVNELPTGTSLNPISGIQQFTFSGGFTTSNGSGDLALIPFGTLITGSTSLFPGSSNGGSSSASPFTLNFGTFGTFTETATPVVQANGTTGSTSSATLYLLGTFTPAGAIALEGFSAGPASLDVAFTDSNQTSYSGSGTLTSPPAGVTPEPSSLVLLGTGLIGAAGSMFRRRNAKT
jgi:hypothetical protein